MGTGRRLRASAGAIGALAVVAVGAYSVAAVAEQAMKDEAADDALYRCDPVADNPAGLAAAFPALGAIRTATWCAKVPGGPEYGRISKADPADLVYYAVVGTDPAHVEAALPGPWQPSAAPGVADLPQSIAALLPASGTWMRGAGSAVYLHHGSGTVVLDGVGPAEARVPTAAPSPTAPPEPPVTPPPAPPATPPTPPRA